MINVKNKKKLIKKREISKYVFCQKLKVRMKIQVGS